MVSLRRPVRAWIPALLFAFVAAFLLPRSAPAQVPAVPLPGATAAAPATAIEKPFLWRIETPVPSYLFGTIPWVKENLDKIIWAMIFIPGLVAIFGAWKARRPQLA